MVVRFYTQHNITPLFPKRVGRAHGHYIYVSGPLLAVSGGKVSGILNCDIWSAHVFEGALLELALAQIALLSFYFANR